MKGSTDMGYFSNKQPGMYYFMTGGNAPFTGTNVPMKGFHFIFSPIKIPEKSIQIKKWLEGGIVLCTRKIKNYSYLLS